MEILLAGNYCHDTLIRNDGTFELLGGSTAYISKALEAAQARYQVVSKVGKDFRYFKEVSKNSATIAIISGDRPTTHFRDTHIPGNTSSFLSACCDPIYADDFPDVKAKVGIACGVANEIMPETLRALRERVEILVCDVQGLIRSVDEESRVKCVNLGDTPFMECLPMIDYLKVNAKEAAFIDLTKMGGTKVLITRGSDGTQFKAGKLTLTVPAVAAVEVDPTGAGDSFIAGLSLGLVRGLSIEAAITLGNRYGAFAVQSLGVPDFTQFVDKTASPK